MPSFPDLGPKLCGQHNKFSSRRAHVRCEDPHTRFRLGLTARANPEFEKRAGQNRSSQSPMARNPNVRFVDPPTRSRHALAPTSTLHQDQRAGAHPKLERGPDKIVCRAFLIWAPKLCRQHNKFSSRSPVAETPLSICGSPLSLSRSLSISIYPSLSPSLSLSFSLSLSLPNPLLGLDFSNR